MGLGVLRKSAVHTRNDQKGTLTAFVGHQEGKSLFKKGQAFGRGGNLPKRVSNIFEKGCSHPEKEKGKLHMIEAKTPKESTRYFQEKIEISFSRKGRGKY